MKYLLLSITVLWLGVHWSSGHSLSKTKRRTPRELVYKVQEDKDEKSLTISTPNLKKPFLREIIYYHIIEKPFGMTEDSSNEEPPADEAPADSNESHRTITDGHGFQILHADDKNSDESVGDYLQLDVRKHTEDSGDITFDVPNEWVDDNPELHDRKDTEHSGKGLFDVDPAEITQDLPEQSLDKKPQEGLKRVKRRSHCGETIS